MTRPDHPTLDDLITGGAVEVCLACDRPSAYAWCDVDPTRDIAHIGATSCWEWACGHCGAHHVERDSPLMAECYTHTPLED